ncbi:alkylation response protein AidB-like acyl-CoA dehydrogenase [Desulfosalsimonas propionicica]|uniref:Alkylation response protein AidB-like acyl-CoA dehydrogenase n=1 Tax=Desulfosalsimonas propionicica TaxID=332175 RepID=A0A7W0C794_9BACT|nr:acyl-CoA dehydrogenase family protein [Desulfosalsimonas propionicica]MBA2880500.1 alkylation response protein AidB-like acyl-CoA dehydrogenase [Desulfosalsimonas propionicica]
MFDYMMDEKALALREEVRDLVAGVPKQMILDMDEDKIVFPREFLAEAGRRNLMGCRYPEKWGGRGMDWATTVMVMEEVGVLGYIFACVFGVGAELVCDAVILHGTDEQKEKYVKPLLAGQIFAAECLTEPRGGSDFFGTTTKAEDKGDHFVLNGQKRFIVGAEAADYFLVYARTNPDPQCDPHKALTCFLVDRSGGVETAYQYGLMGCRGGGAGRVVFKDVKVPKENVLGEVGAAYKVFNTMMIPERLGTAAMTIGAARPALDIATGYTTRRKAFGQTINNYQGVSFQVAEAAMLLDASRAMCHATARAVDSHIHPRRIRRMVSETKKFVTESCQKAAHNAMQVMGGIGYTNIFPIERIVRDLRLASIWTGTNEVMALIIASEWYKEYFTKKGVTSERDMEEIAAQADSPEEKIYE